MLFDDFNVSSFEDILDNDTDPTKPKAYLTYLLFDENMQLVPGASRSFQVEGNGTWGEIGTTQPVIMPENGYLAVFLHTATTNADCHECANVFFDQLVFRVTRGSLKEEAHYYPHGLPIVGMGSTATGFKENRFKYQSNEFNKGLGLNWMNFHNRQYDPQIGRFLGVDPLAVATKSFSSYAAMNNNPASTVDPLGLTGIGIISWVGYAPTRMDQLLMMAPSESMDQLGMTDELRNYNEQMVAAAQAREQARETKQHAATQAWTGKVDRTVGSVKCNRFSSDRPTANEVYGVGGGGSGNDGDGDHTKDGGQNGDPEKEGKFGTYKVWDRAGGYDKKLSKEEADLWYLWGGGQAIYVDNSYIDWIGLSIPKDKKPGDVFSISTTDAFIWLPYETAATYGGTSFKVIDNNTVEVLDQLYHYEYRTNNSIENVLRNAATWWGAPSYEAQGQPYMIHYYNRTIKIK
jgi:RHS repeat-associated protein